MNASPNRWRLLRRTLGLVVALVGFLSFLPRGWTRELDPDWRDKAHPQLRKIFGQKEVADLEAHRIDILNKRGSDAGRRSPERARLCHLTEFPTDAYEGDVSIRTWMSEFIQGERGALAAIEPSTVDRVIIGLRGQSTPASFKLFLEKWRRVPAERRILLSFTASDVEAAEATANVLEMRGCCVFRYLEKVKETSGFKTTYKTDPEQVGMLWGQAGVKLVIDSREARKSPGVFFEARRFQEDQEARLVHVFRLLFERENGLYARHRQVEGGPRLPDLREPDDPVFSQVRSEDAPWVQTFTEHLVIEGQDGRASRPTRITYRPGAVTPLKSI